MQEVANETQRAVRRHFRLAWRAQGDRVLTGWQRVPLELREELPGLRINPVAAGFIGGVGMPPVEGADLGGITRLAPCEIHA